jgi:hypothetical protein
MATANCFLPIEVNHCISVTFAATLPLYCIWIIVASSLLAPDLMNLSPLNTFLTIPCVTNHITKWKNLEEAAEKQHYDADPQWSIFPIRL